MKVECVPHPCRGYGHCCSLLVDGVDIDFVVWEGHNHWYVVDGNAMNTKHTIDFYTYTQSIVMTIYIHVPDMQHVTLYEHLRLKLCLHTVRGGIIMQKTN